MAKIDFSGSSLVRGKWIERLSAKPGSTQIVSSLVRGKWIESLPPVLYNRYQHCLPS